MKKMIFSIAALLIGFYAPLHAFTMQEVKDTVRYCIDIIMAVGTAFKEYVMPPQEGIKSFFTSVYLSLRSFFGQPLTIYDHIIERAKANPLEAVGAIAIIGAGIWGIYLVYRSVYRFFYWLLITKCK